MLANHWLPPPCACALYIDPTRILGFPTNGSLPSFHLLLSSLNAKPFPTLVDMEASKPLGAFSRLNSQISLYTSPIQHTDQPPALVVICSWLFAAPKHIANMPRSTKPSFQRPTFCSFSPSSATWFGPRTTHSSSTLGQQ